MKATPRTDQGFCRPSATPPGCIVYLHDALSICSPEDRFCRLLHQLGYAMRIQRFGPSRDKILRSCALFLHCEHCGDLLARFHGNKRALF